MNTATTFTALEREAFTFGDCWLLARALHNITGWDMVAVGCEGGQDNGSLRDWVHMANRTPEGVIIDINGLHTDEQCFQTWESDFRVCSDEQGAMEVFTLDVPMWEGLTEDQDSMYPEVDVNLVAQRLLALYIESTVLTAA